MAEITGKTLVTGGAGFIGSHIVRQLLNEGREVRVLTVQGENLRNLDGLDIERVTGNVCDPESVAAAMKGCSRVFHLAAIYAFWLPRPERFYEVNCIGSMNVLWTALRQGVERVVCTSSVAAIGLTAGRNLADETTAFNAARYGGDYLNSKWLSEEEAKSFARNGLDVVICNPAVPFGARDIGPTPSGKMLIDIAEGRLNFFYPGGLNVIDVDDVAKGHLLAEKNGRTGERYLLANRNIEAGEFYRLVAEIAGVKFTARELPAPLIRAVGSALNIYERLAPAPEKAPAFRGRDILHACHYHYYDNSKARTELGLKFTAVEESIERALTWFAENGYLKDRRLIREFSGRKSA